MPAAVVISYRLGFADGVSVEAAKWMGALRALGYSVRTVAGEGDADVVIPGLAIDAPPSACPSPDEVAAAIGRADIVVVENVCSLPLNPAAGAAIARCLRGRPAVLRHHDLPWQRPRFASWDDPVPDDAVWRHTCINQRTRVELADRGIEASVVYNHFDSRPGGERAATRELLGIEPSEILVLQPTRAIPRKAVPVAIALAEALGAIFWIPGPAEEGYGPELDRLLDAARCPVRRLAPHGVSIADAYAACDAVAFPSTWEGFGNPTIESAMHRRPLAVAHYPVLDELRALGFEWFNASDPSPLAAFLEEPDRTLLDRNYARALAHFDLADLPARVAAILPT